MKKHFLTAALAAQLLTQLHAGGDFKEVEPAISEVEPIEAEESKLYIIAKGMMILGDDMIEGGAAVSGDKGYGFGIDIGYRIGEGFALECDYSYANNTDTESRKGFESEEFDVNYQSLAFDLVYTYEVSESVGIFGKAGYEYEWENIDDLDEHSYDYGMAFGAGVEVAITQKYKFVAEYEHSTIDGTKGDTLFAGVMYNF